MTPASSSCWTSYDIFAKHLLDGGCELGWCRGSARSETCRRHKGHLLFKWRYHCFILRRQQGCPRLWGQCARRLWLAYRGFPRTTGSSWSLRPIRPFRWPYLILVKFVVLCFGPFGGEGICVWQISTKNSFAGPIQGNTLASFLNPHTTARGTEGVGVGDMQQVRERGYAFLRVLWMNIYFKNWVMSRTFM
jgi:hypothetical protein